jgi:hypothetical protein
LYIAGSSEAVIKEVVLEHSCQQGGMILLDKGDRLLQRTRNVKTKILLLDSVVLQTHEVPLKVNVKQVSIMLYQTLL